MKNILALLAAALLCSCASQRTAPHFDKPSTVPIQKGISDAKTSLKSAKTKVAKIEKAEKDPILQQQILELKLDLDNALTALDTTEGARRQLDTELQQQTAKANTLAKNYDTSQLKIQGLENSRHTWVKWTWSLGGLLSLSTLWILRRPIILLARMFLGIPCLMALIIPVSLFSG